MKVILVDDEAIALKVLEKSLEDYPSIDIVDSFTNPWEALETIRKDDIDVVFLDIEMGPNNGIEMAHEYMNEKPSIKIIFVTAYSQYAVDAFEINAIDYLLKPIQEKRLRKTMDRIFEEDSERTELYNELGQVNSHLVVRSFGRLEVVDMDNNAFTWRTQKAKELFAFLWINEGIPISKSIIMETIFPDRNINKASAILHTTIYQIRKSLEKLKFAKGISFHNDSYQLHVDIVSDKVELDKLLEASKFTENHISKIINLYSGDFLQEEGYLWAIEVQQNIREQVFNSIEKFVLDKLYSRDYSDFVKKSIDKLIEIDPFRECATRYMMEYYGEKNMQIQLNNFYENYKKDLWKEMKLYPTKETIDLYRKYIEK